MLWVLDSGHVSETKRIYTKITLVYLCKHLENCQITHKILFDIQ